MPESLPKLTSLTLDQLARLLSAAGKRRITAAEIAADLDAGAPVNPDGTVNLVHYAAWLAREADHGD